MKRIVLVILALLAVAGPAGARGTVVANDGSAHLTAYRTHHRLCLQASDDTTPVGIAEPTCAATPRTPFAPVLTLRFGRTEPLGMAVPASVTTVELQGGTDRHQYPTVSAAGDASRFVVVAHPGKVQVIRFFDAGGHLVGAAQEELSEHVVPGTQTTLARGVSVHLTQNLVPTPQRFDRLVEIACLTVRVARDSSATCRDGRIASTVAAGCAPQRGLLGGLAPSGTDRVRVVLGSGRRLTIAARPLPDRFGGVRGFAVRVPRGEGVRNLVAIAGSRVIARAHVEQEPTGLPCAGHLAGSVNFGGVLANLRRPRPRGPLQVVATAAGHRLLAGDGTAGTLCAGLDRDPLCDPVPVDPSYADLRRQDDVVGGLVPASVDHVDLALTDGTHQTLTARPLSYTGRYAGEVRYLFATLPVGARVRRAVARDAAGMALGHGTVDVHLPDRTLRRSRRAGVRFRVVHDADGIDPHPRAGAVCLHLATPMNFPVCAAQEPLQPVLLSVSCRPRRAVAYGVLPHHVRGVTLRLRGGGRLRAATVRLGRSRAWFARIPNAVRVRTLRYRGPLPSSRGSLKRVQPFLVRPAARQCGYYSLRLPSNILFARRAARAILSRR